MKIMAISGSLRSNSSNTAVLGAASRLAPSGAQVILYGGLGELPHFNPDLDASPPPIVRELREEVGRADALLISTPEYAHGLPGSLKNLLDWLVGSLEFPGKPVALINTSPRAHHAHDQLIEVLTTMSACLVHEASLTLPLLGRELGADGIASEPEMADAIVRTLRRLRDVLP